MVDDASWWGGTEEGGRRAGGSCSSPHWRRARGGAASPGGGIALALATRSDGQDLVALQKRRPGSVGAPHRSAAVCSERKSRASSRCLPCRRSVGTRRRRARSGVVFGDQRGLCVAPVLL